MSDIVLTLPDLTLPESLAREAQASGLLRSESLASMVRAELRRRRVNQLGAADRLAALDESLTESERRSVVDILAEAPGHLAFQTAEDVDAYLREERDAWER